MLRRANAYESKPDTITSIDRDMHFNAVGSRPTPLSSVDAQSQAAAAGGAGAAQQQQQHQQQAAAALSSSSQNKAAALLITQKHDQKMACFVS
jgi:hypothetical protein